MTWLLNTAQGEDIDLVFRSRFRVLDDAEGCIRWGRAGGGLFRTYHFIAKAAVADGHLLELLQANRGRARRFFLMVPQNRHLSARVRAFVDFMRVECPLPSAA